MEWIEIRYSKQFAEQMCIIIHKKSTKTKKFLVTIYGCSIIKEKCLGACYMNKKAFFFSVELYLKNSNVMCDYHNIPQLLKNIIDNHATVNGTLRTLDMTNESDALHTMLDIYRYDTNYLFARASKQRPTGTVISRDYNTKAVQALLPGISEEEKGIELYTYIYINYESCVLQIISAQGAPNENIIVEMINKYSDDYIIKLIAVPNFDGVRKLYGKEKASISSIELELPNPDPAILEYVLGENGKNIIKNSSDDHISMVVDIKSSISRSSLTFDTESSNKVIEAIQELISNFGTDKYKKARIRGKAKEISARDFNFYKENFYFPVDIPAYRMEGERRMYYEETELAQINKENMQFAYRESKDYILPLIRR